MRSWVPEALLLVVGDGEERARLEALARELGVADRTCASPARCRRRDVMRYMHAADVFLAIADLSNVGNPLLEAMACGMCIVAVDAGDTRDLIVDGETGRLVDSSNRSGFVKPLEERLADLLVALAGDAPQRARLGVRRGRVRARALLDVGPAHGGGGRGGRAVDSAGHALNDRPRRSAPGYNPVR